MRKVKLQMQITLDGFVAGPNGEMDWLVWDWDDELKQYVAEINESVDQILLGRVLAQGFIPAWTSRAADPQTADAFAHKMVDLPKVVFSRTMGDSDWQNTQLVSDLNEVITLKQQPGQDLMLYGGATMVSSFIQNDLIDEYYLFVNPVAIGTGLSIFKSLTDKLKLKLVESQSFSCGIVLLHYQPQRD